MERGIGMARGAGRILRALVLEYLITVIALLALAFAMLKLQPDAGKVELLILAVYALSCLVGGWYAGHSAGQKKFLHGLAAGVFYFLLLFLISGLGEQGIQSEPAQILLAGLLCSAGGMLGGMIS